MGMLTQNNKPSRWFDRSLSSGGDAFVVTVRPGMLASFGFVTSAVCLAMFT